MAHFPSEERLIDCIRDALTPEEFAHLRKTAGGMEVYVPSSSNIDEHHPLSKLLGLSIANKISLALTVDGIGLKFFVPLMELTRVNKTSGRVRELNKAGQSVNEIAHTLGIAARTVYRYLERERRPNKLAAPDIETRFISTRSRKVRAAIEEMRSFGMGARMIGEKLGLTAAAVEEYLEKMEAGKSKTPPGYLLGFSDPASPNRAG